MENKTIKLLYDYILEYHYIDIYLEYNKSDILDNIANTSSIVLVNFLLEDRKNAILEDYQEQVEAINKILSVIQYDLFRELQENNISVADINNTMLYKETLRIRKLRKREDINLNLRKLRRVLCLLCSS